MNHIFYNIKDLNKSEFIDIIEYTEKTAYGINIDKLDVENSWARQSTKMTIDEYKSLILDNKFVHFTVVKRWDLIKDKFYGEVSIRVSKKIRERTYVDYFLWLHLDLLDFIHLTDNFKLKEL